MHELLLGFLGYERVKHAVEAARASLDRARLFMCTPARQASTFAEHRAIVAALKKRDPDAAAAAMEDHLDAVMAELLDVAEPQSGGHRGPGERDCRGLTPRIHAKHWNQRRGSWFTAR